MSEPKKDGDFLDKIGKVSQGLAALKEVWGFANRVADLQRQYKGEAIPIDKLFSVMLGLDNPNPMEFVEKQLAQIDAKLDRVLEGIEELKTGQLGQAVLSTYLDMSDPLYLIEKYFKDLADYKTAGQTWTDAERKDFVSKLLGTQNERDSVAFCAHKIVNLAPTTKAPLLLELLFSYLSAGAAAANAHEIYLKGAYAFRGLAEMLNKALILESFAVASAGGDAKRMEDKMKALVEKYKAWMTAMADNSFLPFAERLATFNLKDEYLGGHNTKLDAHRPRKGWKPANPSILQSADGLAAKLMGKSKSVTLRIIPNVPPIEKVVPAGKPRKDTSYAGGHEWEIIRGPSSSLTRETLLDKLGSSHQRLIEVTGPHPILAMSAESVRKVEIPFTLKDEDVPPGFDKKKNRLSFLRYQFDFSKHHDGAYFTVQYYEMGRARDKWQFPQLDTRWRRWYVEEGKRIHPDGEEDVTYNLIGSGNISTGFQLPPDGQLSPVLVTYAYDTFGPS
jgi:hypothetical protein